MDATIVELERLSTTTIRFYTVSVEGCPVAEFVDFHNRMSKKCPKQLGELVHYIMQVGQLEQVDERQFRPENNAHALPPKYIHIDADDEESSNFGLRLYCCRFTPYIVFLYNGDLKTTRDPLNCPNVYRHFRLAQSITKAIDQALLDEYLRFSASGVEIDEDFTLSI